MLYDPIQKAAVKRRERLELGITPQKSEAVHGLSKWICTMRNYAIFAISAWLILNTYGHFILGL